MIIYDYICSRPPPVDYYDDLPVGQHRDLSGNSHADLPLDRHADIPVDHHADLPAVDRHDADRHVDNHAEVPVDHHAEVPVDHNADLPVYRHHDLPVEHHADLLVDHHANLPAVDRHADLPVDQHADLPAVDRHADLPVDQHVDLPAVDRHVDLPVNCHADLPIDRHADILVARHAELPVNMHADLPVNCHADLPVDSHANFPVDRHAALPDCRADMWYWKTIKEAKLPRTPTRAAATESHFYDEKIFLEFVQNDIDIRDMDQHLADFSQGGDTGQLLAEIRESLEIGIRQSDFPCDGRLAQIGSFYDGSKTGRLNEMDCLYVVSEPSLKVLPLDSDASQFRIWVRGKEVKPRELNESLITAMQWTLSRQVLPGDWRHGGYASPEFSGVRCNGPAITAMFCNENESHISLDVSVAFQLTSRMQQSADFPPHLRVACWSLAGSVQNIQGELTRTQISANLHLIGNLVDDTWQPTTALAEAEILRSLNPECPVKRALEICKAIASTLQKWYENGKTYVQNEPSLRQLGSFMTGLQIYISSDPGSETAARHKLNNLMSYHHIWFSPDDRKELKEVLKSEAQVNTAAIKQIILKTALQMKGAFSKPSDTCRDRLIRAVFEELESPESFTTSHALMDGAEIQKFSIAVGLSHIKQEVAQDLQRQCRTVLDNGLGKVC